MCSLGIETHRPYGPAGEICGAGGRKVFDPRQGVLARWGCSIWFARAPLALKGEELRWGCVPGTWGKDSNISSMDSGVMTPTAFGTGEVRAQIEATRMGTGVEGSQWCLFLPAFFFSFLSFFFSYCYFFIRIYSLWEGFIVTILIRLILFIG
jgi:hypothetical protein